MKSGGDIMNSAFCPRCNSLKSMDLNSIERDDKDGEGKPIKVITTNYHCSDCHSFVCSEEEIVSEKE